jgi:UDP-4-amino-4,6-dideoxy-N-acetyl-beta-L-altrosamine N-acetyltransferase
MKNMKSLFNKKDFSLRLINFDDASIVLNWRNSQHIRDNMYTDHIINIEEHTSWIKKVLHREDCKYLVFNYKNNPVGLSNVVDIDYKGNKCRWGFYLGEKNIPLGTGAVVEYLSLEYLFDNLGFRKVYGEVLSYNKSTIKLHKKFGFNEEGCLTKHVIKHNKYEDIVLLGIFKEIWDKTKIEMNKRLFM